MTRPAQLVHEECEVTVVDLSDDTTTIFTGSCLLFGIYVNTVLSAQACPIAEDFRVPEKPRVHVHQW